MHGDAELLRAYAETGNDAPFREFVRRHLNLVYFAALRRTGGNTALAGDIVQWVFTEVARKAGSLARHGSLTGWLYLTTRNLTVRTLRKERTRQRREEETRIMQELSSVDVAADWESLRPLLDAALDALSAHDREAVLLRFFEGQPFAEIGAALRVSEDAARMRVERALEKLRVQLGRRGITSTTAALGLALANQVAASAPAGLAGNVAGVALAAGAAASSASALSILMLMSATKFIGAAGVLLVAIAIGTAAYHAHAQAETEAALLVAERAQVGRLARLRVVEQQARAAEREATQLEQQIERERAAEVAAKSWDPAAEGKAFLQRHPELGPAMTQVALAEANVKLWKFFQARRLTAEQITELQRLAVDGWWRKPTVTIDGRKMELAFALDNSVPAGGRIKRVKELVGEDGFDEFFTYVSTRFGYSDAIRATMRLSNDLCFTDVPLTSVQAGAVVDLLLPHFRGEDGKYVDRAAIDWTAIDTKVRALLASAQLPAWESALTRTRLAMAAPRPWADNTKSSAAPPSGAPGK